MRKRIILISLSLMLCMLCGCLEATPLTDGEMDVVAEYAASLLLKYDKNYKTPLYYVGAVDEVDKNEPFVPTNTPTPTPVISNNVSGSTELQNPTQVPVATPTMAPLQGNEEETSSQLTELIGVKDIIVRCKGYKLMDSVVSNEYFSLQAKEGRQYVVVSIELYNSTNQNLVFDASGKGMEYSIDVNTGTVSRVSLSMLENDLQYMPIEVPANGTADALLVFEVADMEISTLHMIVEDDNA